MKVLMVGVDKNVVGGMLTVAEHYQNTASFCKETNLVYIPTATRGNNWKKIFFFLKQMPRIVHEIRAMPADIVHVHMGERGSVFREGFVVWMAKRLGAKTIIHMHGSTIEDWYDRQNHTVQHIVSWIFRQADRMVVLGECWSSFMERVMGSECQSRIRILYNGVIPAPENRYNPDANDILFLGVVGARKGVDDLLQAFQMILPVIPKQINLKLYGDSKDYDIQKKISEYGLEGRAFYGGWLQQDQKEACLSQVVMNVLPSYNEGLPMTILETMGYGIPNVSSNIAAIPEVIEDGVNGRLIAPGQVRALAQAMKEVLLDRDQRIRYSEKAYEKITHVFSLEAHFSSLLKIYRDLLEKD